MVGALFPLLNRANHFELRAVAVQQVAQDLESHLFRLTHPRNLARTDLHSRSNARSTRAGGKERHRLSLRPGRDADCGEHRNR